MAETNPRAPASSSIMTVALSQRMKGASMGSQREWKTVFLIEMGLMVLTAKDKCDLYTSLTASVPLETRSSLAPLAIRNLRIILLPLAAA